MKWIKLTTENGQTTVLNTDNIAYIVEPPEDAAEKGVGAGIALVGNDLDVIPVRETISEILNIVAKTTVAKS